MSTTAIVWFRRDLRVHDNPALTAAHRECDRVVPVFVLDPRLLEGRFPSRNRAWFLHGCLAELREALRNRGGELVLRRGRPEHELATLARETGATALYFAADVSPFATARDRRVVEALSDLEIHRTPGVFVADVAEIATKDGRPHAVFSPFHRAWEQAGRRDVHGAARALSVPSGVKAGRLPAAPSPEAAEPVPARRARRPRARERLARRRSGALRRSPRPARRRHLAALAVPALRLPVRTRARAARARPRRRRRRRVRPPARVARLLRPRPPPPPRQRMARLQGRARVGRGRRAARRVAHGPHRLPRRRRRDAPAPPLRLDAQPRPADRFRRMYNPTTQQRRHDPDGEYVRRWVPELRDVPLDKLAEPWTLSGDEQAAAGCVIGEDYPAPVVDHKEARRRAMERYGAVFAN